MSLRLENRMVFENTRHAFIKQYRGKKKFIKQFVTPQIVYPTQAEINQVEDFTYRVWGAGDTYEKLSNEFYGTSKLWWVIATINKKPTEFHISPGDVLFIPLNLQRALALVGIK